MNPKPDWYFDESRIVGVDYTSPEEASAYDANHERFRDYAAEAREMKESLGLTPASRVIDLGCGTGAFALHAAQHCSEVIAVDASPAMLEVCRTKALEQGVSNVSWVIGGFLSYEHQGPTVDAVVSKWVLHHLPDYWKQVALKRLAKMLKPGGHLLLQDVVFPSDVDDLDTVIQGWIDLIEEAAGAEMAAETVTHIKEEYSTFDWVLEGMLERAGFSLESVDFGNGLAARYLCSRPLAQRA